MTTARGTRLRFFSDRVGKFWKPNVNACGHDLSTRNSFSEKAKMEKNSDNLTHRSDEFSFLIGHIFFGLIFVIFTIVLGIRCRLWLMFYTDVSKPFHILKTYLSKKNNLLGETVAIVKASYPDMEHETVPKRQHKN